MRRALAAIGRRATVHNGSTAMIAPPAKSVPTRHAAAIVMLGRRRGSRTGNSATRIPMPHAMAMARSDPSSRVAKVFGKTATGRIEIVLTAIVRKANENSAATRSSRGRAGRGPRKDFGDRPERSNSKPWQKRDAGPRDERGRPVRRAMVRGTLISHVSTSPVTTSPARAATNVRGFRAQVKIVRSSIVPVR